MAAHTSNLEREAEFQADLGFPLPRFPGVERVEILPTEELNTAYFDTHDYRLWQQDISLRHRLGEADAGVWTLKLPSPAPASARNPSEVSWSGDRDALPSEATQLLQGLVRRKTLIQIAELLTGRRRRILYDAAGVARAELDDDTVTVIGGSRDGLRFRRIEVEAMGGDVGWIELLAKELRRLGAGVDDRPELAKALDLPVQVSANANIDRSALIVDVVRASLANALNRLLSHDVALRLEPQNPAPEDVHQARVATRRLRADLKTFRALLDPVWVEHTRDELRWLGKLLGHVRDLDVLKASLSTDEIGRRCALASTGLDELSGLLAAEHRAASETLARELAGARYEDLLDRVHAAVQRPPFFGALPATSLAKDVLPGLVRRPWRVLRRRVRKAELQPSDRELHRIRIGAKQLRYAAEVAAPVVGKGAARAA